LGRLHRVHPARLYSVSTLATHRTGLPSAWAGGLICSSVAILCGLSAFASNDACKGDGTFSLEEAAARPSDWCQASHFPGFPDTLGSTLLLCAVYLTPVLVVSLGWLVAAKRQSSRIWVLSKWLASS
jgi:hypothetical protein